MILLIRPYSRGAGRTQVARRDVLKNGSPETREK